MQKGRGPCRINYGMHTQRPQPLRGPCRPPSATGIQFPRLAAQGTGAELGVQQEASLEAHRPSAPETGPGPRAAQSGGSQSQSPFLPRVTVMRLGRGLGGWLPTRSCMQRGAGQGTWRARPVTGPRDSATPRGDVPKTRQDGLPGQCHTHHAGPSCPPPRPPLDCSVSLSPGVLTRCRK